MSKLPRFFRAKKPNPSLVSSLSLETFTLFKETLTSLSIKLGIAIASMEAIEAFKLKLGHHEKISQALKILKIAIENYPVSSKEFLPLAHCIATQGKVLAELCPYGFENQITSLYPLCKFLTSLDANLFKGKLLQDLIYECCALLLPQNNDQLDAVNINQFTQH